MVNTVEERLRERGLEVPAASSSVANYAPALQIGNLVYVSGQLPMRNGKIVYEGTMGSNIDIDEGQKAAELCALNILGQLKAVTGSLDTVTRCLRLGGFVSSTSHFRDHARVINGASDLILFALGERGRHTRAAVGCSSLPLGAVVEVEAIFEVQNRPARAG